MFSIVLTVLDVFNSRSIQMIASYPLLDEQVDEVPDDTATFAAVDTIQFSRLEGKDCWEFGILEFGNSNIPYC